MYKKKGKKGVKNKCYSSLIVYVKAGPRGVCALQKTLFGVGVARLDLYREEAALGLSLSPSRLHACRLFLCAREKSSSYEQSFAIYKVFPHTSLCTPVFSHHGLLLFVLLRRKRRRRRRLFVPPRTATTTPVGFFVVVVVSSTRDEEQKRTPCCDTTSLL